jgi:tetratricopeptide (TPR) repeat protein
MGTAHAIDSPDLQIAKRHYEAGLAAYDAQDYAGALTEFEAARTTHPAPELTYNIARCLDRLERRAQAAREYESFLLAQPYSPSAEEVRKRIEVLSQRDGRPSALVLREPAGQRRYVPAIAVGVTAVVLAAVGGGLIGGAYHDYNRDVKSCGPSCSVQQSATFLRLSGAAYASFAAAGAATLVDIGLLVAAARRHD